jgi:hypothetical protein
VQRDLNVRSSGGVLNEYDNLPRAIVGVAYNHDGGILLYINTK